MKGVTVCWGSQCVAVTEAVGRRWRGVLHVAGCFTVFLCDTISALLQIVVMNCGSKV